MKKPDPLMTRVRRYVETCQRYGWRPVFTQEQFKAIWGCYPDSCHPLSKTYWLGEVGCTIDDTPRPPMPSEEELGLAAMCVRDEDIPRWIEEDNRWLRDWQRSPRNPQRHARARAQLEADRAIQRKHWEDMQQFRPKHNPQHPWLRAQSPIGPKPTWW